MFNLATLIFAILLLAAAAPTCFGFESRFYASGPAGGKEEQPFHEIMRAWSSSDQTLECNGIDDFYDVHLPEKGALSYGWIRRVDANGQAISFSRKDIVALLKAEQHRHLLVIIICFNFKKYDPSNIETLKRLVSDLEPFINELGYERVLVLKGSDWPPGIRVLKDTQTKQ